ncbi:sensor histidine kinase [Vallitalea okinawensis]|uniref:sensor histidine kinase n=1 Tax=Vallitalea okinawensis TaxID=2078660 RepID=UPI000CFD8E64|nr:sensor histidine kinase [Vallitalea okinawensis]
MRGNFLKKIRVQIAAYSLGAGLLTILLIGVILYFSISGIVLKESLNATETAIQKSSDYIDLYLERLKALSFILAKDPDTINYFKISEENEEAGKNIMAMIETSMETDPFIQSIIMVGKDGRIMSNEKSLHMSMSNDMMKESWYVAAIYNEMPVLTSARMQNFSMDKENWVISLSREIKDEQGSNIGVLLLDIQYKVIEDYLNDLDLGRDGCAFIINDEGHVVYHKDPAYFTDIKLQDELIELSTMAKGYDVENKILVQPYHLKNADWTLIGVSSLDSLEDIKRQLIETLIIVSILLLIGVAFSGTFFAGRITDPINKLEKAMVDIEKGLQKVEITEKGCFEARSLGNHFNKMVARIEELMDEIAHKERYLREYELKVLHSQINPHFLYNTLDTIVWMAEFNDSEKVIAITKALAQFFRLSLSGGSELTTIHNEFLHVSQYLFIQKERYGEKLNYQLDYEEDLEEVKIPKIILQPIVENAIYHGIRGLENGGQITVNAMRKGHKIIFTIEDNGEGFNPGKMNQSKEDQGVKLGGVGIKNVDKRIKLYYGEDYGIQVNSVVGKGTKVIITIGDRILGIDSIT